MIINNIRSESSGPLLVKHRGKRLLWGLMLLLSVIIYGSHGPLITLCKVDGTVPFRSSSVVLLIEASKLVLSFVFMLIWDRDSFQAPWSWHLAAPFALPALLYGVNNNLVVLIQQFMDPSTYQVLSNLKISTTAVLYSIFLHQRLTLRKWFALFLLTVAGVCYAYGGLQDHQDPAANMQPYITLPGFGMVFIYCLISGLSAVYTELILKTQNVPLNVQNLFLYSFGIVLNLGANVAYSPGAGFFDGFSFWVLVIIASQALNGLIMSLVLKHSSNIARLFIISSSLLVNGLLSFLLFGLQLTGLFFLAILLISLSVYLYYGIK
uniref:Probable UDP-sugar transporter protein SLC35A4 n=1 Tax=Geotrypetes seraphini TaxID=260995 RepID=A0A6P8Q976_GEOSA|nr:probable UDP-sugar transporter protein SLC35A4 [Geotrypetes seraphini]XP_033783727.1 probable UDP-sugar transporter protein SLC35A4 [Geotrypetes seraphini]XP_033783728.1 probable UDP-sugar transporter protein SLC35A4 [Geotrypetes seraphini]